MTDQRTKKTAVPLKWLIKEAKDIETYATSLRAVVEELEKLDLVNVEIHGKRSFDNAGKSMRSVAKSLPLDLIEIKKLAAEVKGASKKKG